MSQQLSAARQILEAFRDGKQFLCLRDLANASGFRRASDVTFKSGFNYLAEKKVLKLQQSGWSSEKRGGKNHPKTVVLTADIYEIDSGFHLDAERLGDLDKSVLVGFEQASLTVNSLSESRKSMYQKCEDCKTSPVVFVTGEAIGVCDKHWRSLAASDIEW